MPSMYEFLFYHCFIRILVLYSIKIMLRKNGVDVLRIAIINFSGRADGNCADISNILARKYEKECVERFDFCNVNVSPCGKCDYECFKEEKPCDLDNANLIFESIASADLAFFVMPNYCDYPPANYFAFNERSCGYFLKDEKLLKKYLVVKKKFIVVSNTVSQNFEKAFSYQVADGVKPDMLFLSAKKFDSSSIEGDMMQNSSAQKLVEDFATDNYRCEKSAMAVVVCGEEILYTIEDIYGKMTLSLPKGHVEKGESIVATAMRECEEETGVMLSKADFVREGTPFEIKFANHKNEIVKKTICPVLFKIEKKMATSITEERIKETGYKRLYDFYINCTHDSVRNILKELLF